MAIAECFVPNPKLRLREQLREVARFKHLSLRTARALLALDQGGFIG